MFECPSTISYLVLYSLTYSHIVEPTIKHMLNLVKQFTFRTKDRQIDKHINKIHRNG